jgi:MOSC domain-containing protein YiiM
MASYRYTQDRLGRSDSTYGQFGENLTVDGLPDDEVCRAGGRFPLTGAREARPHFRPA